MRYVRYAAAFAVFAAIGFMAGWTTPLVVAFALRFGRLG